MNGPLETVVKRCTFSLQNILIHTPRNQTLNEILMRVYITAQMEVR